MQTEQSYSSDQLSQSPGTPQKWQGCALPSAALARFLSGYVGIREATIFEKIESRSLLPLRSAVQRINAGTGQLSKLVVESNAFEGVILLVILANAVTLSLEGTLDHELLVQLEYGFLWVYTIECTLKVLGLGLVLPAQAYLKDPWNRLDFIIVLAGWFEVLVQEGVNLSALRTLRILRPLKSITSIKGIKIILNVLLRSVKPLASTLTILAFFCFVFAILGLQLWVGVLKYRCMDLAQGVVGSDEEICGNVECSASQECVKTTHNPNLGASNFDSLPYALLTVFQLLTLEGWGVIMVYLKDSFSGWVIIYFIPLVFFGSFFLINLTLAFIKLKFTDTIKCWVGDEEGTEDNQDHSELPQPSSSLPRSSSSFTNSSL